MEEPQGEIAANFTAPQILSGVAKFLSFTRFSGSTDFADLVSPQLNEQKDYTYGMVVLVTIMVTILFLWASSLIILKYHSDISGCAAGNPFQTSSNLSTVRTSASDPSSQNETFDTTSLDEHGDAEEGIPVDGSIQQSKGSKKVLIQTALRRQRRTRIVFIVFGMALLACTVLLLLFSFSSFQKTIDNSDEIMITSQDIVDQLKATVMTVESAIEYANETLSQTAMDIRTVCPDYLSQQQDIGLNFPNLTIIMRDNFGTLEEIGAVNMTEINRTLATVQGGLDRVRETIKTADQKSWIFPLVLLIIFVIGTAMLVGAVLAWTGKSSSNFEKKMAFGVLPIMILLASVCWLVALGCAIGSLITSDACVDPDATVQSILQEYNVDMNSTTAKLITAYTNGCQGEDPTKVFTAFEDKLQTEIDSIWRHISIADSIGREELSLQCGAEIDNILEGARNLARSLTWTRKALLSSIASLQCAQINAIYVDAVYDSFCTEGGQGLAWAFILFSIVGIGGMVMVSLRASLYSHVGEEEVYDMEDEADNMILNEYEEYLAYIAKYKHEWEEYRGMNLTEPFEQSQLSNEAEGSAESIQSIVASESFTETRDDDTGIEGDSWDVDSEGPQLTETDSEHEYGSLESCATDEISFPSLHESRRGATGDDADPLAIPSMLGPRGSDEAWDQEPDFFLGDRNTKITVFPPVATNRSQEPNVEVHLAPSFGAADINDRYAAKAGASTTARQGPPVNEVNLHEDYSPVSLYSVNCGGTDWHATAGGGGGGEMTVGLTKARKTVPVTWKDVVEKYEL